MPTWAQLYFFCFDSPLIAITLTFTVCRPTIDWCIIFILLFYWLSHVLAFVCHYIISVTVFVI